MIFPASHWTGATNLVWY